MSVSSEQNTSTRQSLLLRVRDLSDRGAWQEFVECYAPRVFAWCRRFNLHDADAADATQIVLMKLVEGLRSFDYDSQRGRFRGWLKTVTRHVAADIARSWRERGTGDSQFLITLENLEQPDAADALLKEVEQGYQRELLRRAGLGVQVRVQPKTWEAYRLTCEEQVAAPQVAEKLAMPVSEVYVSKSRVLKMLREEMRKLDDDSDRHAI
jgi:RNA polymerase sigma-70 factor (ECF subfamily)